MAKKAEKGDGANGEKASRASVVSPQIAEAMEQIASKEDLRKFLGMIAAEMDGEQAAPIYVLTLMNHLLTLPNIYECLDEENRETARAIWLRMKQQGMQLRNPPMLFGEEQPA